MAFPVPYSSEELIPLNTGQKKAKKIILQHIENNYFNNEEIPCIICGGDSFNLLSEKDRYGLPVKTVVCKNCGLVQTNPRWDQSSYNMFYSKHYRELYVGAKKATDSFFYSEYLKGQKIFYHLQNNNSLPKIGSRVLEVGCGAGGILKFFFDKGYRVEGIDLGDEYLEYAKSKHNITLREGSIHNLNFEHDFELIIYSHVLEHILNPEKELNRLREISNDQTIIYFEVPGIKNLKTYGDWDIRKTLQNAHVYYFSSTTLTNLLEKNSYEVIAIDEHVKCLTKPGVKKNNHVNELVSDFNDFNNYLLMAEEHRSTIKFKIQAGVKHLKQTFLRAASLVGLKKLKRNLTIK